MKPNQPFASTTKSNRWSRLAILGLALGFVGWRLLETETSILSFRQAWPPDGVAAWSVLLLPVNLGLEVLKWHRMTGRTWRLATGDVLAGAAAGLASPNRTGDGLARWLRLPEEARELGLRASLSGSAAQGSVTLLIGGCGLAWLGHEGWSLLTLIFATAVIGLYLQWSPDGRRWVKRLPRRIAESIERHMPMGDIHALNLSLRLEILGWSAVRYVVFSAQYALMLQGFGVAIHGADIAAIWLFNAVVPTGALAEMGVREASALAVLQPSDASSAVICATFALWALNLLFPGILGLAFLKNHHVD
ncbi:MAG: hypothetical protein ACPGYK_08645 [Flavobacteriales bacterium]